MTPDLQERITPPPAQFSLFDATPRHSSARAHWDHRFAVLFLVALTAMGCALLATAAPAGIEIADAAYRGAFGGLVVWFTSRSRRSTWAILAGIAALSTATLPGQIAAIAAVLVSAWSLTTSRRVHLAGAVIAALAMPALLTQGAGPIWRLTGGRFDDPFATSAVLTLIATWPVLRSGWRSLSRRKRRRIKERSRHVLWAIVGIFVFSGVVCALAAPSMRTGLNETRDAAELAQSGDLELASATFERAADSWDRSNQILSGPWMVPARLVPVLGQHVRAAQVTSGQASAITSASAIATSRVNPDALVVDGRINLEEVNLSTPAITALAATMERAAERIEAVNSPWLLPPINASIDRSLEILTPAAGITGVAAEALQIGNDLLGGDGQSNILLMFSTPAEARGAGGFVGNWAVASVDDGAFSITEQYRTKDLNALLEANDATLRAGAEATDRYGRFAIERHIQDVTLSPDFPTVAPIAADLFLQATGTTVDAVLLIDPFVVQKLLQFTGPLPWSDGQQLTGSNAAQQLLVEQYVNFDDDENTREAELSALTTMLIAQLFDSPPDPIAFATEMAPLAEQQRVSLWIADDFDGSVAERLGLDGAFPRTSGDLFSVVHQNAGQNKIDAFLERTVALSTQLDPKSQTVHHDVTITLDNTAPASGLPDAIIASNDQGLPPGTNRMALSIYSALPLVSASVDGQPAPVEAASELGANVYTLVLAIPPESFKVIDLTLRGPLPFGDQYDMTLSAQPLVSPDAYSWHVMTTNGTRIDAPADWSSSRDGVRWAVALDRDKNVVFDIAR